MPERNAQARLADIWRQTRRAVSAWPIAATVGTIVVVSLLFLALPGIDLWTSGLFHQPGDGFPAAHSRLLVAFRSTNDLAIVAVVAFVVIHLFLKLARPERPSYLPPSVSLFLLSTLAIGPGLLVNGIFKNLWGRPRPAMVDVFGGSAHFVGVWQLSDQCTRNCSFVAGEASSAVWLMAIALVVPTRWRTPVALVTGVFALLLSLNRIAFGGHFLSDVLLAWGLTWLVVLVAWRFVIDRPPEWLADARLESGLTWLGRRLHGVAAIAARPAKPRRRSR